MELTDNQIVRKVKQGNVEAYSELVQRYQKRIFNLMYRFCQSVGDATELTQDVFCKAFEKLSSFQDGRDFFPWLYTLAMNHGRDWGRKQERTKKGLQLYTDSIGTADSPLQVESIEKQQEINQMLRALSTLPYEKKEMLILRYQQELSIGELGEIFNLSDSGVKMRIHRSLAILQDLLNGK